MRHSIRLRLIISHMLPIFLFVPLVALALIYLLEVQLLLPTLANEMIDQGLLVTHLTETNPEIWKQPQAASAFLTTVRGQHPGTMELLDPGFHLLATNRKETTHRIGEIVTGLPHQRSASGGIRWQTQAALFSKQPAVDVLIPVQNASGEILGYVRLSRRLEDIAEGLDQASLLVIGVLFAGLIVATMIALILAESVSRPLMQITKAISNAPIVGETSPIPEAGSQEMVLLIRAFNRLQDRRFELENARQRMLANLVHEFGRPLGSMRAALHALLTGADKKVILRHELLQGMDQTTDHLARLVEDLSLLHQQNSFTPIKLEMHLESPSEWICRLSPLWSESARQRGIHWSEDIPENLPALNADVDRLEQAVGNLVDNALKFTPADGTVSLQAGADQGNIWIEVKDSGPGIAPEEQSRLFEPFYRSATPPWRVPGLGLGLFITRTIVEAHGGKIQVESHPGQGTKFTIFLPLPPSPQPSPGPSPDVTPRLV